MEANRNVVEPRRSPNYFTAKLILFMFLMVSLYTSYDSFIVEKDEKAKDLVTKGSIFSILVSIGDVILEAFQPNKIRVRVFGLPVLAERDDHRHLFIPWLTILSLVIDTFVFIYNLFGHPPGRLLSHFLIGVSTGLGAVMLTEILDMIVRAGLGRFVIPPGEE